MSSYWEDFEFRHDEVTLSTLLTFPEKTDFGYWFEREIGTEWGWNEYEEYYNNGEFDQTMCGLYFFELSHSDLKKVEERENWVLEQRKNQ